MSAAPASGHWTPAPTPHSASPTGETGAGQPGLAHPPTAPDSTPASTPGAMAASNGQVVPGTGNGRVGSTGLGLDIVRRMAERAGGGLRVDRSPLGGAQILVWLPSGTPPTSDAPTRRRRRVPVP